MLLHQNFKLICGLELIMMTVCNSNGEIILNIN
jgi:hypothetical protein